MTDGSLHVKDRTVKLSSRDVQEKLQKIPDVGAWSALTDEGGRTITDSVVESAPNMKGRICYPVALLCPSSVPEKVFFGVVDQMVKHDGFNPGGEAQVKFTIIPSSLPDNIHMLSILHTAESDPRGVCEAMQKLIPAVNDQIVRSNGVAKIPNIPAWVEPVAVN